MSGPVLLLVCLAAGVSGVGGFLMGVIVASIALTLGPRLVRRLIAGGR